MKKRVKIVWTRQAQEDLRAIRNFIARDAPITAASFVRRLRSATDRLRKFPESGQVIPELQKLNVREVIYGNYRLIYRFHENVVEMLTVFHGAQILDDSNF